MITGGYILTGGGALIRDLSDLGEYLLEKPVKVGYPLAFGGMTTVMQDPKFATVLGLLLESKTDNMGKEVTKTTKQKNSQYQEVDLLGKFSDSLRNVFKEIF